MLGPISINSHLLSDNTNGREDILLLLKSSKQVRWIVDISREENKGLVKTYLHTVSTSPSFDWSPIEDYQKLCKINRD